jgi:hypothetical protein
VTVIVNNLHLDVYQSVFLVTCDDRMSGTFLVVDVKETCSAFPCDTELIFFIKVFDVVRNHYRGSFTLDLGIE